VCINTSPAPEKCFQIPGFSGAGEVYLNTSPAPEKYFYIHINLSDTSTAPEKPGKYFKAPFRRRRSIYIHFRRWRSAYIHLSGAGEVFIHRVSEKIV